MTGREWLRAAFVVLVVLTIQQTLLVHVRVGGAHPDLMLMLPIAAGYMAGPSRGAVVGFASGLLADCFMPTTFGLSALVGCLLGYGVGLASASLVRSSLALQILAGASATAVGLSMYAILGAVLGDPSMLRVYLVPALIVATPAAAILAVPAMRLVRWGVPAPAPGPSGSR